MGADGDGLGRGIGRHRGLGFGFVEQPQLIGRGMLLAARAEALGAKQAKLLPQEAVFLAKALVLAFEIVFAGRGRSPVGGEPNHALIIPQQDTKSIRKQPCSAISRVPAGH